MEDLSLTIPVLYLVFNRLDFVKKTFPEIQKAKPKKLFIACDGPRTEEEKKRTDAVRKWILNNINWKCETKTLFRDKNLGCKYAVAGAIDWFFESVEEGIILEDDCLPDQSFFRFCQEMLERYRDEDKVMSISGTNILRSYTQKLKESYFFSKYFSSWGWATWRSSWEKNDLELVKYHKVESNKNLKSYYPNYFERILRYKIVKSIVKGKVDSWANPFSISHQMNRSLSVIPKINLIQNIGLSDSQSTHTRENKWDKKFLAGKRREMKFPIIGNPKVKENKKITHLYLYHQFKRLFLKGVLK